MRNASKAGEAGRGANPVDDDAPTEQSGGLPYVELPERERKWPRPVRVLFIIGAAAALWGLIFLGFRMLW